MTTPGRARTAPGRSGLLGSWLLWLFLAGVPGAALGAAPSTPAPPAARPAATIDSGDLRLELDARGAARIFLRRGAEWLTGSPDASLAGADATSPLATVRVAGAPVRFVLRGKVKVAPLSGPLGAGERATATFRAVPGGPALEQVLTVDRFSGHPGLAVVTAGYRNTGRKPIAIDETVLADVALDRGRLKAGEARHSFWAFHGVGLALDAKDPKKQHVRRNLFQVERDTAVRETNEPVGGMPAVGLWGAEMGVLLGVLDPSARIVRLDVGVDSQGRARQAIVRPGALSLAPGKTLDALPIAVVAHAGDFSHGLGAWGRALAAVHRAPKPSPPLAYEPLWCNWGYRFDWTTAHGLDRRDTLDKLGIRVVTIDDGWFTAYGDWDLLPAKFPRGSADMRAWVDRLHAARLKAILWWVPGVAGPKLAKEHPDWLVRDAAGQPVESRWKGAMHLCPALPAVQAFHREQVARFLGDWDYDGFKMDGIYGSAPCHAPEHRHADPEESYARYADLYRVVQEESEKLKGAGVVLGQCPCGVLANVHMLAYGNRPVVADPPDGSWAARARLRVYKALLGATYAVENDFHERYNEYFPAEIGAGGVPSTKFTRIAAGERADFDKWFAFDRRFGLSRGEYLALYDIVYDDPETHVVRRGGDLFYFLVDPRLRGPADIPWAEDKLAEREKKVSAFRAKLAAMPPRALRFPLRGLEARDYDLTDAETGAKIARVRGPDAAIDIKLRDHLWLRATPAAAGK